MQIMKSLILGISMVLLMAACGSGGGSSSSTPVDEPLRISCVGDSITQGTGLSNPSEQSYPAQLGNLVADDVTVMNFGRAGRTVTKSGSPSYWDTGEYQNSLNSNPDIVVIMLGTNDMKDINIAQKGSIVEDYKALINSYKNLSSQPTVYINLPPPSYGSLFGITNDRISNVLIPLIREVASQSNVQTIDIYSTLSNKKSLFPDTLHPNAEGARQMAEKVYATIY